MAEQDNKPRRTLKDLDPDGSADTDMYQNVEDLSASDIYMGPDDTDAFEWGPDEVQMDIPPNDALDDEPLDDSDQDMDFMHDLDDYDSPEPLNEGPPIVLYPEANMEDPPEDFNVSVEHSDAVEQTPPYAWGQTQDQPTVEGDTKAPINHDVNVADAQERSSRDESAKESENKEDTAQVKDSNPSKLGESVNTFNDIPSINVKTANDIAGVTTLTSDRDDKNVNPSAATIPSRRQIAEAAARAPFSGLTADSRQHLKDQLNKLEVDAKAAEANILRAQRLGPEHQDFDNNLAAAEASLELFDQSLIKLATAKKLTHSRFEKTTLPDDKKQSPENQAYQREESESNTYDNAHIRDLLQSLNVATTGKPESPNFVIKPSGIVESDSPAQDSTPNGRLQNLQDSSLPRLALAKQKIASLRKQLEDEDENMDEYVARPANILDSIIFNYPNNQGGRGSFLSSIIQTNRERLAKQDFDNLKGSAQKLIDKNYQAARTSIAINNLVDGYHSSVPESDRCDAALGRFIDNKISAGNDKNLQTLLDEGYDAGRISDLAQQRIAAQASVYEFNQALSNYQLLHANDVDREAAFARAMNDPAHGRELQRQYNLLNEHAIPDYEKQFIKESRDLAAKYINNQSDYSVKADKANVDLKSGMENLNKIVNNQVFTPPKTKNGDANELAEMGKRLGEMFSRIAASLGLNR